MADRVIAYSGCSVADTPLEFFTGDEHHTVARILSTWLEQPVDREGSTRQVWRVIDQLGAEYFLRYCRIYDDWEIAPRG